MTDLASEFMAHRQNVMQASAGDELLNRVLNSAKPAQSGAVAPATNPLQNATPGDSQSSVPVRVAKDVVTGAVETPRALVKGTRDMIESNIQLGNELGSWFENKFHTGGLYFSKDGISLLSADELKAVRARGDDLASKMHLPDLNAPTSNTGGMIKGITQFITGMAGAGKYLGAAKLPKAVAESPYLMATIKGAISNYTAFDPHQERLSNLVEQFPALKNPVTAYLASDPTDGDAEGRFKNALEGAGLGGALDGFMKSVRLLRDVKLSKAQLQTAADGVVDAAPREIPADAFKGMGDEAPDAPLVAVKPKPAPLPPGPDATPQEIKAAKDAAGKPESELFINYARIDSPEDVQKVLGKMASASKKNIDAARRGKQSFEDIKLNAEQRDAWADISSRRQGEPFNAEQAVAARQLWAGSAEKLTQLAEVAAKEPSEANLFAFRKMLAVHDTIQTQVIAARTETARALASWRIPAGGSAERMRDVVAALQNSGGTEVARALAERVSALGKAGKLRELGAVVEKTAYARTRDVVLEGWVNGLLSAPTTHTANMTSNFSTLFTRMGERRVSESIGRLLGTQGGTQAGESVSQLFGMIEGMKDMFRYYGKRAGLFLNEDTEGFKASRAESPAVKAGLADATKIEHAPAISSEALRISSGGWLGRAVDMAGSIARTPGTAMGAEDEFFKTVGYRMELNAQALRQASSEVHAGTLPADQLNLRIKDIVANPPENVRMAAADAALYHTFTQAPGDVARAISKLTQKYPAMKVIMPFVKTPANILKYTFERTPLAPIMGKFRADVAAGGARRDEALARMSLGTTAMMSFADLAMQGKVTGRGPVDKSERQALERTGWKPYSMKVGDRWVTYNRLDPIGSLVGLSADTVETINNAQHEALDDADAEQLAVATSVAFAGNLTNKTYLSGLSDMFEALSDPQRYSEGMAQRLAGSVVPSGVAAANRQGDPYVHEVNSMMDAIRARTPGLSEKLPVRRNLWGEPLKYESGLGTGVDFLAPVTSREPNDSPIDKAIMEQGANVTMPQRRTNFDGVTVDLARYPKAYSRYVELAGNELKHPAWKMGAKDVLNAIVSGKHPLSPVYAMRSDGPEGGKDMFIRGMVSDYREMARKQLLKEFPDLAEDVRQKKAHARALKMPVMQGQ